MAIKQTIRWIEENKCLNFWKEAIKRGYTFRIADITESFKKKEFYEINLWFNNETHLNTFLIEHKGIILLNKWDGEKTK